VCRGGGEFVLSLREEVRVDVHGHVEARVTAPFLYVLGMRSLGDQKAYSRVTEIVGTERRQARSLDGRFEVPADPRLANGCAFPAAEHEVGMRRVGGEVIHELVDQERRYRQLAA
jgi:hypothetical protein